MLCKKYVEVINYEIQHIVVTQVGFTVTVIYTFIYISST